MIFFFFTFSFNKAVAGIYRVNIFDGVWGHEFADTMLLIRNVEGLLYIQCSQ
jgi:hypothetical protein